MLSVITVCAGHAVARPGAQIEVEIEDRCMDIEIIRGGRGVEMERGRGRDVKGRGREGDGREGEMEIWRDG